MSMLHIKLVRSRIATTPLQRKVLDAMGLKRREATKSLKDNAATRGMIAKVVHLVEVTAS